MVRPSDPIVYVSSLGLIVIGGLGAITPGIGGAARGLARRPRVVVTHVATAGRGGHAIDIVHAGSRISGGACYAHSGEDQDSCDNEGVKQFGTSIHDIPPGKLEYGQTIPHVGRLRANLPGESWI